MQLRYKTVKLITHENLQNIYTQMHDKLAILESFTLKLLNSGHVICEKLNFPLLIWKRLQLPSFLNYVYVYNPAML